MSVSIAKIIDGRALAARAHESIRHRVEELVARGVPVRLDAILTAGNPGSSIYARNQEQTCRELGITYCLHELSEETSQEEVLSLVDALNRDDDVHAMMVHLPLAKGVDTEAVQSAISAVKDVEGVNPANIGNIIYGRRSLVPCTARAVMEMIESTGVELRGACCVCVGASNIVGKPVMVLLMRAEATVISTNIHTPDTSELTRSADVLVSATGVPGLITADMVKPGAIVIDVGVSRITDDKGNHRVVGDVRTDEVARVAGAVSPVPGGVGPMTVAMLLRNTVDAAEP